MSSFGTAFKESQATAAASFINGATFVAYSGTAPANADTALSGNTALSTHTGVTASATGSVITVTVPSDAIDNSGTFSFARLLVGGTAEWQGSVGAEISVNNTNYVAGGNSNVITFTLTHV